MLTPPTEASLLKFPESWHKPAMPGYGTFPWPHVSPNQDYEEVAREMQTVIEDALTYGYRHIDTAFTYRNQEQVGLAVAASGIPRNEVFIASKLHPDNNFYYDAKNKIKEAIRSIWGIEFETSSKYLDSFLIHYPGKGRPLEAWKALLEGKDKGILKHIGVSNFEIWHLNKLKKKTGIFPEINQIEFHPWIYQAQKDLLIYCHDNNIAVEGYSPLAQGVYLQDPTINQIAEEHNTTPARVILKWCMKLGVRPIIGSINIHHLRSNAEIYAFELTEYQMDLISKLGNNNQFRISEQWRWNPKLAPFGNVSWLNSQFRKLTKFIPLHR